MPTSILRSVSFLALASAALSASAAVTYTFNDGIQSFTVTTSTYIVGSQSFALNSASTFVTTTSATFTSGYNAAFGVVDRLDTGYFGNSEPNRPFTQPYNFQLGAFGANGVYDAQNADTFAIVTNVLTVSGSPTVASVPGPLAALPFALMAFKRRKRA